MTNIDNGGLLSLQLTGPGTTALKDIEQKINTLCNTKVTSIIHTHTSFTSCTVGF